MNKDSILFAMANPVPEIMPDLAKEAGAKVVGTGRSDFPNQVNNVVAFPGIFKGALEGRATRITEEMKLATAKAIAGLIPEDELNEDNILPEAFATIREAADRVLGMRPYRVQLVGGIVLLNQGSRKRKRRRPSASSAFARSAKITTQVGVASQRGRPQARGIP